MTAVEQVVRPIDRFLPSADEVLHIAEVEEKRINACLSEHGYAATYRLVSPALKTFVESSVRNRAARTGMWGLFDTSQTAPPRYTLTAEEATVDLPPVPEEATADCGPADPNETNPVLYALGDVVLPNGGPVEPVDDSRLAPAIAQWSDCMKTAGYDYSMPADPLLEFVNVAKGVDDRQLAIARADVDCKRETNLVGVALAIRTGYDNAYIAENQTQLDDLATTFAAYAAS